MPRVDAQVQAEYRLGHEDEVQIQVINRPDLSGPRTVGMDGKLLDPYLNEIQAAGRTEAELSKEFTQRYRNLVPGVTQVQVTVLRYNSRRITVTGEVRRPGTYGYRVIPDLLQIVMKDAQGMTPAAEATRVQIIREEPLGDEPTLITVDLSSLLGDSMPDSLPMLRPGDTINVPSLAPEGQALGGATFQVLGSVRNPGVYSLRRAGTLALALAISGGPLAEANLRKVHLTRIAPEGVVAYQLDVEGLLYEGRTVSDMELQEGDTVTVPIKRFGPGTIGRGLVFLVPLITSLTSLILIIDR